MFMNIYEYCLCKKKTVNDFFQFARCKRLNLLLTKSLTDKNSLWNTDVYFVYSNLKLLKYLFENNLILPF